MIDVEALLHASIAAGADWMERAQKAEALNTRYNGTIVAQTDEIVKLKAVNAELAKAFVKFGGHLGACAGGEYSDGQLPCDCGYKAVLAKCAV